MQRAKCKVFFRRLVIVNAWVKKYRYNSSMETLRCTVFLERTTEQDKPPVCCPYNEPYFLFFVFFLLQTRFRIRIPGSYAALTRDFRLCISDFNAKFHKDLRPCIVDIAC